MDEKEKKQRDVLPELLWDTAEKIKQKQSNGTKLTILSFWTAKKSLKCSICDTTFTKSDSLNMHMKKHTMEFPFQCNLGLCIKAFKTRLQLREHKDQDHQSLMEAECPKCSRRFLDTKALRIHLSSAHQIKIRTVHEVHKDSEKCAEKTTKAEHKREHDVTSVLSDDDLDKLPDIPSVWDNHCSMTRGKREFCPLCKNADIALLGRWTSILSRQEIETCETRQQVALGNFWSTDTKERPFTTSASSKQCVRRCRMFLPNLNVWGAWKE